MPRPRLPNNVKVSNENEDPNESVLPDSDPVLVNKEGYIRDLQLGVKSRIQAMEDMKRGILTDLDRLLKSDVIKIKKEFRQMKIPEFEAKGGDLSTMDLKEAIVDAIALGDVSFAQGQNSPEQTINTAGQPGGRVRKKVLMHTTTKQYFEEEPLPTSQGSQRATRSQQRTPALPATTGKGRGRPKKQQSLVPKFNINKPPAMARCAVEGETLVSLAGSPVVGSDSSISRNDTSQLFSVSANPGDETVFMGGKLFENDSSTSPNSRANKKQLLTAINEAIKKKLDDLNNTELDQS